MTVRLEGAAEIVNLVAPRATSDQAIGEPRGQLTAEPLILPVLPPATDDVAFRRLVQSRDQPRNVPGVVLSISVHCDDHSTPSGAESGGERRCLPEATCEFHDGDL